MNDDFAILAAVAASPAHPYALLEHLQAAGIDVARSTLYRRVEVLIAQGWLEADDIRAGGGHYRRALALSRQGIERVESEALEMLRSEPLESPLFTLAVAAAGRRGTEELLGALKPRIETAARRLTAAERELEAPDEAGRPDPARERRIAHLRADIAWLQGLMRRRVVGFNSGDPEFGSRQQRVVHR